MKIEFGDELVCAETGKTFIAARDGLSTNYATSSTGDVLSDEGVHIRQVRDLLDRSVPFPCYLSDAKTVTGWKGNILGNVVRSWTSRSSGFWAGMTHVRVIDVHGKRWYGKCSGPGCAITLYPNKEK